MHTAEHQGVTIAEAAAQLGLSSDTIRRRLRRGELRDVQVPTPNGNAWPRAAGRSAYPRRCAGQRA